MSAEATLKALGIELPAPPKAAGNYIAGVEVGNLVFMSGCVPRRPDGSYIVGKVGIDLSVDEGYEAARAVALSALSRIRSVLGSLDRVKRIVKVHGMVNAAPDFKESTRRSSTVFLTSWSKSSARAVAALEPLWEWLPCRTRFPSRSK